MTQLSVPTLHQQLTDLWEAEWSGEGLSESAVAQKFLDYVEGFEFELREQIAQDIMIQIEAPTNISSDWYAATRRTKMVASLIAKGEK
jgi:hypothetical protein